MPLYVYECVDCKLRFDKLRPVAVRDEPIGCPDCGGHTKRVLAKIEVQVKKRWIPTKDGWQQG